MLKLSFKDAKRMIKKSEMSEGVDSIVFVLNTVVYCSVVHHGSVVHWHFCNGLCFTWAI
jgi:hypothetical protein